MHLFLGAEPCPFREHPRQGAEEEPVRPVPSHHHGNEKHHPCRGDPGDDQARALEPREGIEKGAVVDEGEERDKEEEREGVDDALDDDRPERRTHRDRLRPADGIGAGDLSGAGQDIVEHVADHNAGEEVSESDPAPDRGKQVPPPPGTHRMACHQAGKHRQHPPVVRPPHECDELPHIRTPECNPEEQHRQRRAQGKLHEPAAARDGGPGERGLLEQHSSYRMSTTSAPSGICRTNRESLRPGFSLMSLTV